MNAYFLAIFSSFENILSIFAKLNRSFVPNTSYKLYTLLFDDI